MTASTVVQIPLYSRDGQVRGYATVDAADISLVSGRCWRLMQSPMRQYAVSYVAGSNQKRAVYMHRLLMGVADSRTPDVDHIDGDGLNNQRANLRLATRAENCQNRHGSSRSVSGFRGVTRNRNQWVAHVRVNGEQIRLGRFTTPEEAHAVVSAYRAQHMPFSADARQEAPMA